MCGRYELHTHPVAIALAFGLAYPPEIGARYNIAPMQQVPIVRVNAAGERELVQVRWGFVPRWAKDPSIGVKMINARGETAATKASFRTSFRRHRCLLPADAFYEWQARGDGTKQPMRIGMTDGSVFGLAGLYERWLSPEGEPLDTCTILTTEANPVLKPLHDRMPVIVPAQAYEQWLDPAAENVGALVAPFTAQPMSYWPVSTRVNSVKNDDAQCIEPITLGDEESVPHTPVQAELPVAVPDEDRAPEPKQTSLF